jgi:tetratricopeptide (TPR) repeat protein
VRTLVNLRLLNGTLIALAIVASGGYALHRYQAGRMADVLLDRAHQLQQKQEWSAAAEYFQRYLQVHPDQVRVRADLAETFAHLALTPQRKTRAVELYYQALGGLPRERQPPLRRHLVELLLELGRSREAETEARSLLRLIPNDPQGWKMLAFAMYQQSRLGNRSESRADAGLDDTFQRALQRNPGNVELSTRLAYLIRDRQPLLGTKMRSLSQPARDGLADGVIDRMVAAHPADPEALLARYLYRVQYQRPRAEEDLRAALKHGPSSPRVLFQAAEHFRREAARDRSDKDAFGEARTHYERLIQLDPHQTEVYLGLGDLYLAQGEAAKAIEVWEEGRRQAGQNSIPLRMRLAEALIDQGRTVEADRVLHALAALIEQSKAALPVADIISLGGTLDVIRAKRDLQKAEYARAAALLEPLSRSEGGASGEARSLQASLLLGVAYAAMRQWDQAANAYQQAAQLTPARSDCRLAAGNAWMIAGRPDKAIECYDQALTIESLPETWLALARARLAAQLRRPRADREWEAFQRALEGARTAMSKSSLSEPWRVTLLAADRAMAERQTQGKPTAGIDKAKALLHEAETAHLRSAALAQSLAVVYQRLGNAEDADRMLTRLDELAPQTALSLVTRSQVYCSRRDYAKARATLQSGLRTLPVGEHYALEEAAVQVCVAEGRLVEARQRLAKLQEAQPQRVDLIGQLIDLALECNDRGDASRWEAKLRDLEGPEGCRWRYHRALPARH